MLSLELLCSHPAVSGSPMPCAATGMAPSEVASRPGEVCRLPLSRELLGDHVERLTTERAIELRPVMGGEAPATPPSSLSRDWCLGVKAKGSCGLQDIGAVSPELVLAGEPPELPATSEDPAARSRACGDSPETGRGTLDEAR